MASAHHLGFHSSGTLRDPVQAVSQALGVASLRDDSGAVVMGDWFGSAHRYEVPLLTANSPLTGDWDALVAEVSGWKVAVLGPLSYLWLARCNVADTDKLTFVDDLLSAYDQLFNRLAEEGVSWVQIDEPILTLALPQAWKNAYERAYNLLQRAPLKKLVATYHGGLGDNLGLAANLPVDGLHIDCISAPQQYATVVDRLPAYKVLSLGIVGGTVPAQPDLAAASDLVCHAADRLGERLWLSTAAPLAVADDHSPHIEQALTQLAAVADTATPLRQAA